MAYSRRLGVVSILSACWFVSVACSDDEDRKPNVGDAGEGGDDGGGKAGTPSVGGNMSQGGKAGSAGSAGSAGDAGSGTGGTGEAGSGGIVAGAGGEGGSGVSGGGGEGGLESGGAGGEGGDAPVAVAKSCVDVCEDDDDCVDGAGFPKKCDEATKVCEACSVDADCVPELSDWFTPCETTEECGEFFACVDFNSGTYCAVLDDPQNGAGCADLGEYESAEATLHEGGAAVSVCVKPFVRCLGGTCGFSCESFDTCPDEEGDTCNPVSGRCECQNSTECSTGLLCVNNLCTGCVTDGDCSALGPGLDKCVAGKCGCTDLDSCEEGPFPDATNACQ